VLEFQVRQLEVRSKTIYQASHLLMLDTSLAARAAAGSQGRALAAIGFRLVVLVAAAVVDAPLLALLATEARAAVEAVLLAPRAEQVQPRLAAQALVEMVATLALDLLGVMVISAAAAVVVVARFGPQAQAQVRAVMAVVDTFTLRGSHNAVRNY